MQQRTADQNYLYEQGIANLKLEGMNIDLEQDKLARSYLAGSISKKDLIQKALDYARSQ